MKRIKSLFLTKKRAVLALLLALTLILVGWKMTSQREKQAQYQTATAQKGTIVSSVSASGQVVTTGRMPILSQASGQVNQVYVKNGDKVSAGQKILSLTLDPSAAAKNASAWASYLQAKTQLDAANAALYTDQSTMFSNWKTYLDLATNSTYQNADQTANDANRTAAAFHVAQDNWLSAEATYKNQQTVVSQAQAAVNSGWQSYQLTSADLVAPITGTIADLTYVPGMLISSSISSSGITQSQMIASILTDSLPTITVNLSEVDVNRVSEGNKATITFDALPDKTFTSQVVGINKTGVVTSGVTNYPATIKLDTNLTSILSNMSASANIIVATKNDVLLVPSEAVQTTNGQSQVRLLRNGQPETRSVETGLSSDTQTEIVSGLSIGDSVITGTVTTTPQTGQSPFNTLRVGGGGVGGFRPGGR